MANNTRRLHEVKNINPNQIHTCTKCNREYKYIRNSGHRAEICNSCVTLKRKILIKQKAIKYKGGSCSKCGYNKCVDAMSFHHINPNNKSFAIAGNYNRKWIDIEKELDKCILLCFNCHIETHFKEK